LYDVSAQEDKVEKLLALYVLLTLWFPAGCSCAREDKEEELSALYVFLTPWFLAGCSCAREDKEEELSALYVFFTLWFPLQDVPVPGKIRRRNSRNNKGQRPADTLHPRYIYTKQGALVLLFSEYIDFI
jgi:hypothetical protein